MSPRSFHCFRARSDDGYYSMPCGAWYSGHSLERHFISPHRGLSTLIAIFNEQLIIKGYSYFSPFFLLFLTTTHHMTNLATPPKHKHKWRRCLPSCRITPYMRLCRTPWRMPGCLRWGRSRRRLRIGALGGRKRGMAGLVPLTSASNSGESELRRTPRPRRTAGTQATNCAAKRHVPWDLLTC